MCICLVMNAVFSVKLNFQFLTYVDIRKYFLDKDVLLSKKNNLLAVDCSTS